jgi:hypothetical protein
MVIAEWLVNLAMIYAALGIVFAVAFVTYGVERIDSSAKGAPVTFLLLIIPGAAALWPVLLMRWLRGCTPPPVEKNAHRVAAQEAKR